MSAQGRIALKQLVSNVEKYSPQIEAKLIKAGVCPDPTLVLPAAKYYPALKKLAKE